MLNFIKRIKLFKSANNKIKNFNIVYPYYNNGDMFAEHQKKWLTFPRSILNNLHFVIIDDGSLVKPATDFLHKDIRNLNLDIYRIDIDRKWNQHGAKNLGALFCVNEWMFLSDMDHFLPLSTIEKIFSLAPTIWTYFTFKRVIAIDISDNAHSFQRYKPHPNTYLVHWQLYWRAGGYNEDYCGYYGTDWIFRKSLKKFGREKIIDTAIIKYPRSIVPDANTTNLERKSSLNRKELMIKYKLNKKNNAIFPLTPLRFPWHKAYPNE